MNTRTRVSGAISTPQRTYITAVVDTSSSMSHLRQSLKDGMNEFCDDQKKKASNENRLSSTYLRLVTFDTEEHVIYDGPIEHFEGHEFICDGLTRLYDTVTDNVRNLIKKMMIPKELAFISPAKGVLIVMTDGENNVGTPYPNIMQKSIIDARKKGVICTFMGANQDAVIIGDMYGFSPDASLTFTPHANTTVAAMRAVSSGTQRALSQPVDGEISYTQMERQSSSNSYVVPPQLRRANAYPNSMHSSAANAHIPFVADANTWISGAQDGDDADLLSSSNVRNNHTNANTILYRTPKDDISDILSSSSSSKPTRKSKCAKYK